MNDLRVMRERQTAASKSLDQLQDQPPPSGSAGLVVRTTTVTTYPTAAQSFFAANPVTAYGAEKEGNTPTLTADTTTVIYILNLGTAIPPNGTDLTVHAVGGKWCCRYDG